MLDSLPVLDSPMVGTDSETGFGALETSMGPLPLKALGVKAHNLLSQVPGRLRLAAGLRFTNHL